MPCRSIDGHNHIPGLVPRFDISGCLNHAVQRVAAIDDRPVPPRLDELLHEQHILLHVSRWDQHQHLPVSEPRRPQRQDEVLQSVGGQVTAAPLQRAAAVLEREGAGCIEDDVVRLAVLGEVFLLVVDHLVGSDRSDDLEVFRAAHPGDVGAEVLGQLHPGGADGPRRAVHEDSLSLLEICRSQALQSQDRSVADGCGLVEAHTIRHVRQRGRFPHAHELRVRSEPPRIDAKDMVADGELSDGRADCFDLSCKLRAEDPLPWP